MKFFENLSTTQKKIIAITGVALVAFGGLAVLIYLIMSGKSSDETPYVNANEHLGVVGVVSKEDVQAAFGQGAEVTSVKESGTFNMDRLKSETASYIVRVPDGKVQVDVDAKKFPKKKDLEAAAIFVGAEKAPIANIGDEAHYMIPPNQALMPEHQTALMASHDNVSFKVAIVQKSNKVVYGIKDAKAILLKIAQKADFSKVK